MYIYIGVCVFVLIYVYIGIYIEVYIYISIFVNVYIYVCIIKIARSALEWSPPPIGCYKRKPKIDPFQRRPGQPPVAVARPSEKVVASWPRGRHYGAAQKSPLPRAFFSFLIWAFRVVRKIGSARRNSRSISLFLTMTALGWRCRITLKEKMESFWPKKLSQWQN